MIDPVPVQSPAQVSELKDRIRFQLAAHALFSAPEGATTGQVREASETLTGAIYDEIRPHLAEEHWPYKLPVGYLESFYTELVNQGLPENFLTIERFAQMFADATGVAVDFSRDE